MKRKQIEQFLIQHQEAYAKIAQETTGEGKSQAEAAIATISHLLASAREASAPKAPSRYFVVRPRCEAQFLVHYADGGEENYKFSFSHPIAPESDHCTHAEWNTLVAAARGILDEDERMSEYVDRHGGEPFHKVGYASLVELYRKIGDICVDRAGGNEECPGIVRDIEGIAVDHEDDKCPSVAKARLDAEGTARPKTQIISHYPDNGNCVGPGAEESYTILNLGEKK